MFIASSNQKKLSHYKMLGLNYPSKMIPDQPEPYDTPEMIVAYKSFISGVGSICEDTCLFIEGHQNLGVLIKYTENNLDEFIGLYAASVIVLSKYFDNTIEIYKGITSGKIGENKFKESSYGFDGWFYPIFDNPNNLSLHELNLIDPIKNSIRKGAASNFVNGEYSDVISPERFKDYQFVTQEEYLEEYLQKKNDAIA